MNGYIRYVIYGGKWCFLFDTIRGGRGPEFYSTRVISSAILSIGRTLHLVNTTHVNLFLASAAVPSLYIRHHILHRRDAAWALLPPAAGVPARPLSLTPVHAAVQGPRRKPAPACVSV